MAILNTSSSRLPYKLKQINKTQKHLTHLTRVVPCIVYPETPQDLSLHCWYRLFQTPRPFAFYCDVVSSGERMSRSLQFTQDRIIVYRKYNTVVHSDVLVLVPLSQWTHGNNILTLSTNLHRIIAIIWKKILPHNLSLEDSKCKARFYYYFAFDLTRV